MKKHEKSHILIVGYTAICISLVSIGANIFHPVSIKVDMFNTVVTVLSVITAILLGFQILNIINFSKEKQNMFKEVEDRAKILSENLKQLEGEQLIMVDNLFNYYLVSGDSYQILSTGMDFFRLTQGEDKNPYAILRSILNYGKARGFTFGNDDERSIAMSLVKGIIEESAKGDDKVITDLKEQLLLLIKSSKLLS